MSKGIFTHTWSILGYNATDGCRLNTVDDVVASSRYQVAVAMNCYIILSEAKRHISAPILVIDN